MNKDKRIIKYLAAGLILAIILIVTFILFFVKTCNTSTPFNGTYTRCDCKGIVIAPTESYNPADDSGTTDYCIGLVTKRY